MSPEKKLDHLLDWICLWIEERDRVRRTIDFFFETGVLLHQSKFAFPSFENYIEMIEYSENKNNHTAHHSANVGAL